MENMYPKNKDHITIRKHSVHLSKCPICYKIQCYNCLIKCASIFLDPEMLDIIKSNKIKWNFYNLKRNITQEEFILILTLTKVSRNLSEIGILNVEMLKYKLGSPFTFSFSTMFYKIILNSFLFHPTIRLVSIYMCDFSSDLLISIGKIFKSIKTLDSFYLEATKISKENAYSISKYIQFEICL